MFSGPAARDMNSRTGETTAGVVRDSDISPQEITENLRPSGLEHCAPSRGDDIAGVVRVSM